MSAHSEEILLELESVSLSFQSGKASFEHGTHHVLNDVSLSLYKGETLGILGKNGAGKTTMLRVMAGILAPSSGVVRKKPRHSAALLSLGLGFKQNLTGRYNAMLSAMLQGSTYREAEVFLEDIKEFSELGDSFEEPVKTYSSGMKARLGFTTALMTHVDILLIDEVLSVGDAHFKQKAGDALKKRMAGDQTVVFVSHSEHQIRQLCSRAIWIDGGRVGAEGDVSEVLQCYKDSLLLVNKEIS